MPYQVPQNIDPNKIFLVNFSDLQGRLDPSIYKPQFKYVSKTLPNVMLSEIAWIDPPCNFSDVKEVSFIPMDAIDSTNGIVSYKGIKDIEDTKGFTKFREGDILWAKITPCMQNAKSAIANNLLNGFGCGSTEFFVIRPKSNDVVLQEYLLFLLRDDKILKSAMNYFGGSAGQQRVPTTFLKYFNVPLPNIESQRIYCDIIGKAQKSKLEKHQQAETLLQSIDDYLLGELGITLPNTNAQSLNDRIFTVNYSEVCGGRLDPKGVLFLGEHAKSTKYSNIQLKQIATIKKGEAITSENVDKNGHYPVIAGGQTSPYNHNIYNYDGDVITVSASGAYSGYVWYHNYPIFASDCSVIYSKDDRFTTKYIFEVLKAQQSQIYLLQQGAGQPHVYPDDLGKLWIPIIDKTKQQEIVDHITKIRQQAKQLQVEGDGDLKKAKEEVERMILN
ncbi:MAG: restriction endonuclease subunit S [Bacteroidales bacterium]|nr:restriction endonuclease subunit S [Bacteroidales bacterium]